MSIVIRPTAQTEQTLKRMQRFDCLPDLRRELVVATAPMVQAARMAARKIPSTRGSRRSIKKAGSYSLRDAVASAVKRVIKLKPKEVVVGVLAVPHGGKSNLSRVVEGEISPWKHPTFGHDPEVEQRAHPWFYDTLEAFSVGVTAHVESAIARFERKI